MITNFKADLFWGATGTTKTSNIGRAAMYFYEKTGKRTRLVTADLGGYEPIQPLVEEGIVEPLVVRGLPNLISTVDRLCQGYWPKIVNGKSVMEKVAPETWEGIAVMAFEGLTSFGDAIMGELRSKGTSLSQDPNYTFNDGSGITYYGSNKAYYGFVQDRIYDLVAKSQLLPVERVIWTALEAQGEDSDGRPIMGPDISGKKAIPKAGQWFGNFIHLDLMDSTESIEVDKVKQTIVRSKPVMFLKSHLDPASKQYFRAKTRAPFMLINEVPDYMDADAGKLYEMLDKLKEQGARQVSALKK